MHSHPARKCGCPLPRRSRRSPETIRETLEARAEFIQAFGPAIVGNSRHYYAIPKKESRTPPHLYEKVMEEHGLSLKPCRPDWMNFDFIDCCYQVEEHVYDPDVLRELVEKRIASLGIPFQQKAFAAEMLRVGKRVYCQTPNRWFPVEPHYLALLVHWLPRAYFTYFVHRYMTVHGLLTKPSRPTLITS